MGDFFNSIIKWFESTQLPEQIQDVDFIGLFTNPWFIVPFALFVGYMLYKAAWRDLAIIAIFIAVWWVSGTEYMNTLVEDKELNVEKILPVVFGGAVTLGVIIYLLLGRSD